MRFSNCPMIAFQAFALTMIVVQGKVKEADAYIHKPKVLPSPGPTSTSTTAWAPKKNDRWSLPRPRRHTENQMLPKSHQFTHHRKEQSQRSMEMSMAHRSVGIEKGRTIPSVPIMLGSVLTVAALFKTKSLVSLLATSGWFIANFLYKPYQGSLVNNPLVTKVLTGAILAIVGDAAAQATSKADGYDKRRAISFAMFDSCYRVFQHNVFPLIIRLGQGNQINKLLPAFFAPAAAAIEQTLMYQFVIVPVSKVTTIVCGTHPETQRRYPSRLRSTA